MLCLFKSNRKFRKMLEYNQNLWTRRRCVSDGNSLGKSSVLHIGCIETILCFEAMLNQILVFENTSKIYALLHSHLVRGLDVFWVLSRRPMQLLRYREFHIMFNNEHFLKWTQSNSFHLFTTERSTAFHTRLLANCSCTIFILPFIALLTHRNNDE